MRRVAVERAQRRMHLLLLGLALALALLLLLLVLEPELLVLELELRVLVQVACLQRGGQVIRGGQRRVERITLLRTLFALPFGIVAPAVEADLDVAQAALHEGRQVESPPGRQQARGHPALDRCEAAKKRR